MTFKEYLEIEMKFFNPWFDRWYKSIGLETVRVNRKGHDVKIIHKNKTILLEEKTRLKFYPDILIEDEQDEGSMAGWVNYCDCDKLLYSFADEDYNITLIYLIYWEEFKTWYKKNKHNYKPDIISTEGFGKTINRPIPIVDMLHKYLMTKIYHGSIAKEILLSDRYISYPIRD